MRPDESPNAGLTPDELAARLLALPKPVVPAGLEDRLLARIPARKPTARRRLVGVVAAGALAAACLVVFFAWHRGQDQALSPDVAISPSWVKPQPAGEEVLFVMSPWQRRAMSAPDSRAFAWPIQETAPLKATFSIPADLFR